MKKEEPIAEKLAKEQRSISISEFFLKNKHLLGFDNPRKALLTTIKEAIDNSLDACEEARVLPDIIVEVIDLGADRFEVSIEDNGPGIIKQQIPNIFGKLLYGSKFHKLKCSRGQQGIGISAAAMYGQLTTGKPITIVSKIQKDKPAHFYELHIDTKRNEPQIITEQIVEWEKDHGTKIKIILEAKYQKGKQGIDEYLEQTAIVNPHLYLIYTNPEKQRLEFPRATKELPKEPKEIKPHPYGVELGILINMLQDTKSSTLQGFLQSDFCRVSANVAKEICDKAGVYEKSRPSRIAKQEAENLYKAIQEVKIIAPPTDSVTPIGEELILKGLKKEINADFYASITRSPSVYRGNPFIIECCTGDTNIILEDGGITNIKSFVENCRNDKVFSMNSNLKIKPTRVISWQKFKNEHKILKIKTKSGRELKITDNNKLPIIENGEIIWKEAKEVMAGDFIATPKIYNIKGIIPNILDLFDSEKIQVSDKEAIIYALNKLKEKFGTIKEISSILNVNYDHLKAMFREGDSTKPSLLLFKRMCFSGDLDEDIIYNIKKIRYVDNGYKNPNSIKVPRINEDLLYILGLLNSDGYISKNNISFVNKDEGLHKIYSLKISELFGLNARRYKNDSVLCNKTLFYLFKEIEKILTKLPDSLIIAWLKGFVDGDGWISLKKDNYIKCIGIATAKKEKAKLIQFLLLRLGILSKIEKQNISNSFGYIEGRLVKTLKPKYNLVIQDFENIAKFSSLISFRQLERSHKLSSGLVKNIKHRRDVIPIGNLMKRFREENNLYQYDLGFSDTNIRQIEKNRLNICRGNLQQIVEMQGGLGGVHLEKLKKLVYSDILFDKIIDIELSKNEEYVYDLTTEEGNFVANNIIMHNCGLAYGGDIPKEDSIRLLRFANRVPLQYQQSACAVTKSVIGTIWRNYGLSQSKGALPIGPVVLLVHIASVWVPFTSESKEAIAHYPEIVKEIKLALQDVGRKLASYIRKHVKAKEQRERASLFENYIPELAASLSNLTGDKKEKIQEDLLKILKKGIPELEENGQIEE